MILSNLPTCCKITIVNQISEINKIADVIEMISTQWKVSKKIADHINLAIEEVVSNIIYYAYTDKNEHVIVIELNRIENGISIKITDDGKYFNLLESENDIDIEASVDKRKVGGLGIFLAKTLVNHVEYQRFENKNIITLTKYY